MYSYTTRKNSEIKRKFKISAMFWLKSFAFCRFNSKFLNLYHVLIQKFRLLLCFNSKVSISVVLIRNFQRLSCFSSNFSTQKLLISTIRSLKFKKFITFKPKNSRILPLSTQTFHTFETGSCPHIKNQSIHNKTKDSHKFSNSNNFNPFQQLQNNTEIPFR
jgi:hypothetical protein